MHASAQQRRTVCFFEERDGFANGRRLRRLAAGGLGRGCGAHDVRCDTQPQRAPCRLVLLARLVRNGFGELDVNRKREINSLSERAG